MFTFKRGDTFPFKVKLSPTNDEIITIDDISTIFVTCKNGQGLDARVLFQKEKKDVELDENGYLHIVFKPEDTENLSLGIYDFDVEVTLVSGFRKSKVGSINLEYDVTTEHKEG